MFHSDLIEHRERKRQVIAFEDLQFGSIAPMDIDGCIEYKDRAVVFMEYKLKGASMPQGQRLCLERLANDVEKAGRVSMVLLCEHEVIDPMEDVNAGRAMVKAVYYKGQWHKGDGSDVKGYIVRFLNFIQKNNKKNKINY